MPSGVERARVFDGAVDLLVHVVHADRHHVVQLMVEAERRFLQPHRLQIRIDRVGAERRVTEVDRSADQRAGAGRRAVGAVDQGRPVEGVERVVVLDSHLSPPNEPRGSSSLKMS